MGIYIFKNCKLLHCLKCLFESDYMRQRLWIMQVYVGNWGFEEQLENPKPFANSI